MGHEGVRVATPQTQQERRQFGRIDLEPPLRGMLDEFPIRVVEASVTGVRVEHDVRIMPAPSRLLRIEWDHKVLEFRCMIARSMLFRLGRTASEKSVYHSGIRILEWIGDAERMLRELIANRVIRALEDQKENARGIPPIGEYVYQVGKGDRFRRCELNGKEWRKSETTDRSQPPSGFTVSAELAPPSVDLLCRTYEREDENGRRLTQMLAELSIKKEEGGTTRRYVP